ncbi:MAG: lipid-transfer protein [Actinomycetota bacterium]|nr:lipid-transfer protein [Actinomycetota bacterium]
MTVGRGRQAVAVGIHALPFAKDLQMTERRAGALAIVGALADAGLGVADVDGLVRFSWEHTTEMEMARILGVENLRVFGSVDFGGGAGAPVLAHAAMAIERGVADVVVAWRARNRASGGRPWEGQLLAADQDQFERPYGLVRPVDGMAMHTRRWMHSYGWRREDLGLVAVTQRHHARRNPRALMQKPLTMEDYLASRMIAEPLCLFDNCLETDGALALVLTSAERAADLPLAEAPAYVTGYAMGSGPDCYGMTFWYGDELGATPARWVAPELWRRTGLGPEDVDVVQFYDAFTPQVPISFHEYGFCGEGEGPDYIRSGTSPPFNTSGGGLSEAYVHGFNLLLEGVRQVRGTSTSQADDVDHCLVTSGNVVPTGAIVFSRSSR